MPSAINLAERFSSFTEHWAPRIIARYEGHKARISKLNDEFEWHTDTHHGLFLCIDGGLDIELRDRTEALSPGDLLLIEAGEEYKPNARQGEVRVLLLDPENAPNTRNRDSRGGSLT